MPVISTLLSEEMFLLMWSSILGSLVLRILIDPFLLTGYMWIHVKHLPHIRKLSQLTIGH